MSVKPGTVAVDRRADAIWVTLAGEFDLASAARFEETFPSTRRGDMVVVDMRELEFIDSVGIRVLMQRDVSSRAEGWSLVLLGAHGHVRRVLELCHVHLRITTVDDPSQLVI